MKPRTTCPDCGAAMEPIKMLDEGDERGDQELRYAAGGAQPNWFLHRFPIAGKITAVMCGGCGLIRLYGDPTAAQP